MRILLLSRYDQLGASSRLRSFQYIPFLTAKGWQVDVNPLFSDEYVQALYNKQPLGWEVLAGYIRRFATLIKANKYDLIWIEKELFPFMPAVAERLLNKLGVPYVVDYDDALFHRYDEHRRSLVRKVLGRKIDTVMNQASQVVAGNQYLADRAQLAGAGRIAIIPTVIDLKRYPLIEKTITTELVIGWIGSPSTTHYLLMLAPVFASLRKKFNVKNVAVGADQNVLEGLGIEVMPWSEQSEVSLIQQFDIGIMPLDDSPWERGKCGYKLIQYMACSVPVVASPVGVNKDIVEHGVNGFLAQDLSEWEVYLTVLLESINLRKQLGLEGRKRVENYYSLQAQAPRLEQVLRDVVSNQ